MIQPNELRIGNWLQTERRYFFKMEHIPDTKLGDYSRIYPIPLTPEILEKAGWVKNERFWWKNWGTNGCEIVKFDNYYNSFVYQLGVGLYKQITNLHQLQNLFYALTGEELQIEL